MTINLWWIWVSIALNSIVPVKPYVYSPEMLYDLQFGNNYTLDLKLNHDLKSNELEGLYKTIKWTKILPIYQYDYRHQ